MNDLVKKYTGRSSSTMVFYNAANLCNEKFYAHSVDLYCASFLIEFESMAEVSDLVHLRCILNNIKICLLNCLQDEEERVQIQRFITDDKSKLNHVIGICSRQFSGALLTDLTKLRCQIEAISITPHQN